MEQNMSFVDQPLQPSIIGITQSPSKKYSCYRIPQLLVSSKIGQQKKSSIQSIRCYNKFKNEERSTSRKTQSRIKYQICQRKNNDYLPTIKKNDGNGRSSHLGASSVMKYDYPQRKEIYKQRSVSTQSKARQNEQINDYLQQLNQKQQHYQNQRYLQLKQPISVFHNKIKTSPSKKIHENGSRATQAKMIKLINMKTEYMKERNTLSSIYFSFRRQNIFKGKLQKRIPKIPTKLELEEFISNYITNNHQIDLQNLIKANFCVIEYSQKQLYIGEMIGKHKNGIGILVTQKSCFEGEWKNNQKVKGIEITMSGVYKGTYLNNQRFGKGQFQRHTGQLYLGEWIKGKKHGTGLWINTQGQSYEGQWRMGKANGQGMLKLRQRSYNGYFEDFKQQGFGREQFKNGDSFQGIFRKDFPYGEGTYRWKNVSRFTGRFYHGMRYGNGELYYKDKMIYKGNFINDKPDGECQIFFKDGKRYQGKVRHRSDLIKWPIY